MTQSKSLPRNIQISEKLIREIASGLLSDGSRLPPEREMAADYGVAVGTLRKALDVLEEKGLLERVQGSGNYVRRNQKVRSIYSHFHLELITGGGLPTAKIFALKKAQSPETAVGFGFVDTALRIDRIRLLDDVPVAIERIWLNGIYSIDIKRMSISESLYQFYKTHLGVIISSFEDRVGVSRFPEFSPIADLKSGQTSGYIERRARDQSGQAAEFSQTWFDPHRVNYFNRVET